MNKVTYHKRVIKALKKLPVHITKKLQTWGELVEEIGIEKVRKIKGYHDEPLFGNRKGQRSVRLSKAYRAFYIEHEEFDNDIQGILDIVEVEEGNKHEY